MKVKFFRLQIHSRISYTKKFTDETLQEFEDKINDFLSREDIHVVSVKSDTIYYNEGAATHDKDVDILYTVLYREKGQSE